jgi:hypothetical protein
VTLAAPKTSATGSDGPGTSVTRRSPPQAARLASDRAASIRLSNLFFRIRHPPSVAPSRPRHPPAGQSRWQYRAAPAHSVALSCHRDAQDELVSHLAGGPRDIKGGSRCRKIGQFRSFLPSTPLRALKGQGQACPTRCAPHRHPLRLCSRAAASPLTTGKYSIPKLQRQCEVRRQPRWAKPRPQ